ncbi:MAG: molybdopterin oxidoreductase family protein [Salinirussus sp.]
MTDNHTAGTVCPYCAVGCRLEREQGRVVGRAGPANPDGRLCEKGLRAFEPVDGSDRLTTPLIRVDGTLEPASWEQAITRAVEGLRDVRETHGPHALGFLGAPRCTTEENYLLAKLARVLGTNNIDNRARGCHAATAGVLEERLGWPASTNTVADLPQADIIIVVGANPAVRQPVAFNSGVRAALKTGGTLIHIDPHRNETTRPADYHLAPRPGTDARLLNALCALVVENGGIDAGFVRDRTTRADETLDWLDGLDVSAAAQQADIERKTLDNVAGVISAADRVAVLAGTGADRRSTANAIVNLLLITGNFGRPGTGMHILRGLANEQGAVDAGCAPDRLPGHRHVTDETARAAVADEWGVEPPAEPGYDEAALLEAAGTDVHGLLVVGENPAVAKRDADRVADSLAALSTLIVAECTESETTRHADVVLPAATGVEKAGTVTNLDRTIQRLCPLADAPGEARADVDILRAIGAELIGEAFSPSSISEIFAEFASLAPPYSAVDYQMLRERPRRWPAATSGADGDPSVLYEKNFSRSNGKAPLVVPELSDLDDTDGLILVVGDRAGQFAAESGIRDERVTIHPADAAQAGISHGMSVRVIGEASAIRTTALVSEAIREGTVFLHASVADPLVRDGANVVDVRPITAEK